jgi:hypothetical protein
MFQRNRQELAQNLKNTSKGCAKFKKYLQRLRKAVAEGIASSAR